MVFFINYGGQFCVSGCCFLVMQLWLESAHAQHCAPTQNYATVHHHIKVMQAQLDDELSKKQPTETLNIPRCRDRQEW